VTAYSAQEAMIPVYEQHIEYTIESPGQITYEQAGGGSISSMPLGASASMPPTPATMAGGMPQQESFYRLGGAGGPGYVGGQGHMEANFQDSRWSSSMHGANNHGAVHGHQGMHHQSAGAGGMHQQSAGAGGMHYQSAGAGGMNQQQQQYGMQAGAASPNTSNVGKFNFKSKGKLTTKKRNKGCC
jgi:hypothetical protein